MAFIHSFLYYSKCQNTFVVTNNVDPSLCMFFVAATVKLQQIVISEPNFSPSEQSSN